MNIHDEAAERLERIVAEIAVDDPAWRKAVTSAREMLEEEPDEKTCTPVASDDLHRLADQAIRIYLEFVASRAGADLAKRKYNHVLDSALLSAEEMGIETTGDWEFNPFRRVFEKAKASGFDAMKDGELSDLFKAICALLDNSDQGDWEAVAAGFVPDEVSELIQHNGAYAEFLSDLGRFLSVSGPSGRELVTHLAESRKFALAVKSSNEVFPRPLLFLAAIHILVTGHETTH
ncbi:MAG: hypothetical protein ABW148_17750 [Sedimenticola sp.]